ATAPNADAPKPSQAFSPPSSKDSAFTDSAALFMMAVPVADSPVKAMAFTSGWRTSASPAEPGPKPCTRLNTPGGTPTSCMTSASSAALEGVSSEGFATTVLPQASAGATFQVSSRNGRFQGAITATTPTGLCTVELRAPRPSAEPQPDHSAPPAIACSAEDTKYTAPRWGSSIIACANKLPASAVSQPA